MKLKSVLLIAIALFIAALLPLINFIQGDMHVINYSTFKNTLNSAYKTDHLTGWLNLFRQKLGYSSDPEQAVIGKSRWMYLGDHHNKSITVSRGMILPPEGNYKLAQQQRLTIDDYARESGALGTYFMIAPNKESVYPEYLPDWALAKNKPRFNERFLQEHDRTLINLLPTMLETKARSQQPIYLKTDSHWNNIGAWAAYIKLSSILSKDIPTLRFLADNDIYIEALRIGQGGDISNFLFLSNLITDIYPSINIKAVPHIKIQDLEKRKVLYEGENKPLPSYHSPTLVTSTSALNDIRVLWLRDSFGIALSPFMAATFRETIQSHWKKYLYDDIALKKMIDVYRPNLVIFTIVERGYFWVVNDAKETISK